MTVRSQKHKRRGVEEFCIETITLFRVEIDDPESELVEASVAAERLGVTRATMTGYMDRGTLAVVRRSGSTRRWLLRSEVEALAASRAAN